MEITKSKVGYLFAIVWIILGLFMWVLSCPDVASADDSAHGDATNWVNRSTAACDKWPGGVCTTGACTHCHDTFDKSICGVNPLMLFDSDYDTSDFCLKCHTH